MSPQTPGGPSVPGTIDPWENSKWKGLRPEVKGKLVYCPYCQTASVLGNFNFACMFMPALKDENGAFSYKGADGECPECDRYVRLKDTEDVETSGV